MSLLPFIAAAFALAITPGPGMAYVVARTVAGGRTEGLASCFGTALGGMLHVVGAALGLSILIAQSALAFSVLKYVGAGYLVYLGIRTFMREHQAASLERPVRRGSRHALMEGMLVEIMNVKTALFFLAFLPQFVSPQEPLVNQLALLGSVCVGLNTLVDVAVVLGAHRLLHSSAMRATRARLMTRISGATMIGLGGFLALARRGGN